MTYSLWKVASKTTLEPADDAAAAVLAARKTGQFVRAEVASVRSPEQLRLWWALITAGWGAQDFYATTEDFAAAVKCALGHAYVVVQPDGTVIQRPKSIALGNMKSDSFNEFMDATTKLLAEKMGVTVDSLRAEASLPPSILNASIGT